MSVVFETDERLAQRIRRVADELTEDLRRELLEVARILDPESREPASAPGATGGLFSA